MDKALQDKLKRQSENLWKIIDALKVLGLKKPELADILTDNAQDIPVGVDKVNTNCMCAKPIATGVAYTSTKPCR